MKNLNKRLVEVKRYKDSLSDDQFQNILNKKSLKEEQNAQKINKQQDTVDNQSGLKKKTNSTQEYLEKLSNYSNPEPNFQKILDDLIKPISREVAQFTEKIIQKVPLESYLDSSKFGGIDYGKVITDEILAADNLLLDITRKNKDVAGTTALIALLVNSNLVVANVGDSRGVMCDSKGNAIPLSFDHKPQQLKESKRIKEAGGFIAFNGVWRVAGILATSRALGDYPLKYKNFVIADPDILSFDLKYHKPQFIILASDGLWDTFTNEEVQSFFYIYLTLFINLKIDVIFFLIQAVAFIKDHIDEPHYGAKSIALQSYYRGSYDNITVIIINLKDMKWGSYAIKPK